MGSQRNRGETRGGVMVFAILYFLSAVVGFAAGYAVAKLDSRKKRFLAPPQEDKSND